MIRTPLLILSMVLASGLLFVNIYTSMVDAVSWGNNMPDSIATARDYYKVSNPGNFFRLFSPMNQVIALLCVVFCWKAGNKSRYLCLAALLLAVAGDALTFGYFYPRNAIMFSTDLASNLDNIRAAWNEWTTMNWFRSAICAAGLVCVSLAHVTVAKNDAK